ncbi:Lsr2 family protein [Williamsia sp. DF01-3]|uniref:histone-like nucleoid-structuring protein Lsr2 n=1 Tax=Williamsia sp. DF01-3 TaxID=2934157 RepID=UPI001FF49E02|nr:Lsr2 family protein [Williamsia sp. DF01-3]MCK0517416.1 Lsr2 family protein [Williamsia sp. DF01-3]
MAKKQTVQFIDDLDGAVLEEFVTIRWALDGKHYEFDTSPEHAAQFRKAIDKYLTASRRVNNTAKTNGWPAATSATGAAAISAWATANGYDVNVRGRLPESVIAAYNQRR